MYGRLAAGTAITATTHHNADTTNVSVATTSCSTRRPNCGGPNSRYTRPNAGSTSSACNSLARNPEPTIANANTSQRVLPASSARVMPYAPSVSNSTRNASGLLKRNMSTATGVSAVIAAARSPAPGRNQRLTVAYTTATVATPSSACGTRMLHAFTPKMRAEISITQSEPGDLSTVMKFELSNDPKKNAFQLFVPAWTAAE